MKNTRYQLHFKGILMTNDTFAIKTGAKSAMLCLYLDTWQHGLIHLVNLSTNIDDAIQKAVNYVRTKYDLPRFQASDLDIMSDRVDPRYALVSMNDTCSIKAGKMPFGKFAGEYFEDIDHGYLNWIIKTASKQDCKPVFLMLADIAKTVLDGTYISVKLLPVEPEKDPVFGVDEIVLDDSEDIVWSVQNSFPAFSNLSDNDCIELLKAHKVRIDKSVKLSVDDSIKLEKIVRYGVRAISKQIENA